jgi:CubicO group peptidase (beta-lactamase class C family)
MGRFVYYNFANITDHEIFPYRTAVNDSVKFTFETPVKPRFPKTLTLGSTEVNFDEYLEKNKTVAFLIIKNDSIQYEKYFKGYDEASVVASFSMAKSVTSMLIGCAIDDGLIKSVDEPVTNYIPEFKNEELSSVTIKNLLQMTSGIKFNESYYNPFGDAATFYYGRNLRKGIYKRKLYAQPGTTYSYSSGDTQILGLVLERALKGKAITQYLQEKIWKPLGMEYDATWSLDREKDGLEKTFCCLNARARDFAKVGRLYLNKGNWNGTQIVPQSWVEESTTPDTAEGGVGYYKYQWWLEQNGNYAAKGILGQYIFVCPSKNLVIVRLGEDWGDSPWDYIFNMLAEQY